SVRSAVPARSATRKHRCERCAGPPCCRIPAVQTWWSRRISVAPPPDGTRLPPERATGRSCPTGRSTLLCPGTRRSRLMLVVTLGNVVLTRTMTPAENGVDVIQGRYFGSLFDLPNFDLNLATLRK